MAEGRAEWRRLRRAGVEGEAGSGKEPGGWEAEAEEQGREGHNGATP